MERYFSIKYPLFSIKQGLYFGLNDTAKHKTGTREGYLRWIQKAIELTNQDK